ncbi:MAG: ATP-dependent DNA ligase [Planctomycetota bacterium]
MQRFTDLYQELDATSGTTAKTAALVRYFSGAHPADSAWAVALFLGKRPKGTASSRVVTAVALELSGVAPWLFAECRAAVGELAETIALLLPASSAAGAATESLTEVIEQRVLPLAGADEAARSSIIRSAFEVLPPDQRYVYLKLIRGGFRVGVQRRILARALATLAGVEPAVMEHRLAGVFVPRASSFEDLLSNESEADDAAKPYPFFLASQLDVEASSLGPRSEWLAEWKWDGIRCQLVCRDQILLWSRGDELITHQFPEITAAASHLPPGTVLDGEVLLWDGGAPLPFAALQRRLNRKAAPTQQLGLFATDAPVFMAFDILEDEGADVRGEASADRRRRLERRLADSGSDSLRLSPLLTDASWTSLAERRSTSRSRGVEGLMLKHVSSPYAAGRVKPADSPGWWKWKIDPLTADAVLVYAYPGTGKRATLFTDYAFAVWGERDGKRVLLPFTRAYSGLDQAEIEKLDAWIRRNTIRTMGPAREVRPERVFEIGFEGIAASPRHKAGIAVRFPRILREREDKPPEDADTLEMLQQLLAVADRRGPNPDGTTDASG